MPSSISHPLSAFLGLLSSIGADGWGNAFSGVGVPVDEIDAGMENEAIIIEAHVAAMLLLGHWSIVSEVNNPGTMGAGSGSGLQGAGGTAGD